MRNHTTPGQRHWLRLMLTASCCFASIAGAQTQPAPTAQTTRAPSTPDTPLPPLLPVALDPALDTVTATRLTRFTNDAEFDAYLATVSDYSRARHDRERALYNQQRRQSAATPRRRMGLLQDEPVCDPTDPACAGGDDLANIVVTGGRAAPPNVTNVQSAGVDEGDIVKQIGDYLVVLQDGRLFSVDMRRGQLALRDRQDIYRSRDDDRWYDEILVEGDHVIVANYSNQDRATEISVFRLDQRNGRLSRAGSFLTSSEDYYSGDNYATRIVGDNLIIYTPYDASELTQKDRQPRVRRWLRPEERDRLIERADDNPELLGRSILDAQRVYRPLLRTNEPAVHTITICPLGDYSERRTPDCRATGFVGPKGAEMFVAPDAVYLWVGTRWFENSWWARARYCDAQNARRFGGPAAVYRLPITGGNPSVVGVHGAPFDHFSMDMQQRQFRILMGRIAERCAGDADDIPPQTVFANIPLSRFSQRLNPLTEAEHIPMPAAGPGYRIENRFADDYLVYGSRIFGYGAIPDPENPRVDENNKPLPRSRHVVVVPVHAPRNAARVAVDHNVIRIDRVGADRMIVNGYGDDSGLSMSLLQLGPRPTRIGTTLLPNRYESEGRSHAFNSNIAADRSGLLGIPTVARRAEAERYEWFSEGSDVSFISVTRDGTLRDSGPLLQGKIEPGDDYRCEVSCIDWYGNSRPIFTGGRIFALMATEIAEGRMVNGRIEDVRRVNLTQPDPHP